MTAEEEASLAAFIQQHKLTPQRGGPATTTTLRIAPKFSPLFAENFPENPEKVHPALLDKTIAVTFEPLTETADIPWLAYTEGSLRMIDKSIDSTKYCRVYYYELFYDGPVVNIARGTSQSLTTNVKVHFSEPIQNAAIVTRRSKDAWVIEEQSVLPVQCIHFQPLTVMVTGRAHGRTVYPHESIGFLKVSDKTAFLLEEPLDLDEWVSPFRHVRTESWKVDDGNTITVRIPESWTVTHNAEERTITFGVSSIPCLPEVYIQSIENTHISSTGDTDDRDVIQIHRKQWKRLTIDPQFPAYQYALKKRPEPLSPKTIRALNAPYKFPTDDDDQVRYPYKPPPPPPVYVLPGHTREEDVARWVPPQPQPPRVPTMMEQLLGKMAEQQQQLAELQQTVQQLREEPPTKKQRGWFS